MDSFKRARQSEIKLIGTDIESLKGELEMHLSRISIRQPKDISLQSNRIPMGLSAFVPAGEEISAVLPFPLAGTLQDFMSFVPGGVKEVFVQVTVIDSIGSQRVETRLLDTFRAYNIQACVKAISYAKIKIMNRSKIDADCVFGFTFKEVLQNEVKETKLVGDLEGGTVS